MPSSVAQDKGTAGEADAMAVDSSSDVEILEERNGSPAASANAAGKRKMSGKLALLSAQVAARSGNGETCGSKVAHRTRS